MHLLDVVDYVPLSEFPTHFGHFVATVVGIRSRRWENAAHNRTQQAERSEHRCPASSRKTERRPHHGTARKRTHDERTAKLRNKDSAAGFCFPQASSASWRKTQRNNCLGHAADVTGSFSGSCGSRGALSSCWRRRERVIAATGQPRWTLIRRRQRPR